MILPQNIIFSKHQIKAEFKNLDDSEVPNCDFPGLRNSAASMTSTASDRKGAEIQHDISWFHPSCFFQNNKIKLNSRTWRTLEASVVNYKALETLQPQWPQQPQLPQWPPQTHFIKKFTDYDGWIIPGTQMTSNCPFLWNGSSKFQFFTDIWYPFCQRLLRLADVTFFEKQLWYPKIPYLSIPEPSSNQILFPYLYLLEPIIKVHFNVR